VLVGILLGFWNPVYAQSDLEKRIAAMEKELAELKAEVLAQKSGTGESGTPTTDAGQDEATSTVADASGTSGQDKSAADQLPIAGMQGSPNPLQDDKRFLTGQDLLDDSFPNSWPIFGSDVRMSIGGYVKADFVQDFDYVGDRFEFELATIPVEGTPEAALDGQTTLHAKESRINFDFRTAVHNNRTGKDFPMQIFLEWDFFEDREELAKQPRLRHAYGVLGRILVGQSWTTSADLQAIPGLIDFAGGDALYGNRATQIRWADRASESMTWAVALENPDADVGNPLGLDGVNRNDLPNFAWRTRWASTNGSHLQVAGDVFPMSWQGGESGPSDDAVGWGLNITGRWLLGKDDRDAVVFGVVYGDGAANRIVSLGGSGSSAVLTPDGKLETLSVWEANVGYSHYWTDALNSTIAFAWTELDNSDYQPDDAIHRASSFHANLIWFPYKRVSTGFEIMYGERVNKDGASGDAWRAQYMAKYKFN
jgi:hypothetical protein